MSKTLSLSLAALLASACGPSEHAPTITTGPNIVRTPAGCARALADGRYINDKLGVACHFARFNGERVCIPDDLPTVIRASCDPNGGPYGPGKVQVDLSKDGCAKNLPRYVLSPKDKTKPVMCDDIEGTLREVIPETLKDQRIYFGPDNLHCEPSPLSAQLPDLPFVNLVAPSIVLYENDMPSEVCK